MSIKLLVQAPEINPDNPFEGDILWRGQFGNDLKEIVTSVSEPLVLGLDAPWGSGKTIFLRRWSCLLKNEGVHVIYVDAFESDFFGDVPSVIFDHLISVLRTYTSEDGGEKESFSGLLEKVQDRWKELIQVAGAQVVKGVTAGMIDVSDYIKALEDEGDYYLSLQEKLNTFKDSLAELAKVAHEQSGNPLVIIVDELDRCRPSHAVHLLESIKHVFSVPKICFVLSMHKQQLDDAVRAVHGCKDPHAYLQKMIHLVCRLPDRIDERVSTVSVFKVFVNWLAKKHGLEECSNLEIHKIWGEVVFEHLQLTLREMERAYTLIAIALSPCNKKYKDEFVILSILSAGLAVKDPNKINIFLSDKSVNDSVVEKWLEGVGLPTTYLDDNNDLSVLSGFVVMDLCQRGGDLYDKFKDIIRPGWTDSGLFRVAIRKMMYFSS